MGLPSRLSLSRFAASSVTCLGPHNSRPSIRKRTKKKGLCFSDLPAFTCTEPDLWPSLPRGVPRVAGDRGVPRVAGVATFGDVELPWRCLFIGVVELCSHCLFLGDSCPALILATGELQFPWRCLFIGRKRQDTTPDCAFSVLPRFTCTAVDPGCTVCCAQRLPFLGVASSPDFKR